MAYYDYRSFNDGPKFAGRTDAPSGSNGGATAPQSNGQSGPSSSAGQAAPSTPTSSVQITLQPQPISLSTIVLIGLGIWYAKKQKWF